MKKNDGYVIIYVVFVIIILCLAAAGTCTSALSVLKAQNAAVEQLQERYTAEGNIEQFMAQICVLDAPLCGDDFETEQDALAAAMTDFAARVTDSDTVNCVGFGVWADEVSEYRVSLESACGSTKVSAEAAFAVSIEVSSYQEGTGELDEEGAEITATRFAYCVSGATSSYRSYALEIDGGDA